MDFDFGAISITAGDASHLVSPGDDDLSLLNVFCFLSSAYYDVCVSKQKCSAVLSQIVLPGESRETIVGEAFKYFNVDYDFQL